MKLTNQILSLPVAMFMALTVNACVVHPFPEQEGEEERSRASEAGSGELFSGELVGGDHEAPQARAATEGGQPEESGTVLPGDTPAVVVPTDTGELVTTSLGELEVTGDAILFDAFAGYGNEELALLKAHPSWPALSRARLVSFSYPGRPLLDLPEGVVSREAVSGSLLPANVARVIRIFDEHDWDYLTPVRDSRYSYRDFLTAVAKWPRFCAEMNVSAPHLSGISLDQVCAQEVATVFAHFAQEVGAHSESAGPAPAPPGGILADAGAEMPQEQWRQGLFFIEELGYAGTSNVGYRQCEGNWALAFPCGQGVSYHGRGAKQLSYNYNYGPFSRTVFGAENMHVLLEAPERVAEEGWLALSSALYFYMTPRAPKPSIHETVSGLWLPDASDLAAERAVGFGVSIQIINGGLECNSPNEAATAKNRRLYFEGLSKHLGIWEAFVSRQPKHDCIDMSSFAGGGQYDYPPSWIAKWDGSIGLATWEEGPFSPLFPGNYYRAQKAAKTSSHWDWEAGKGALPEGNSLAE